LKSTIFLHYMIFQLCRRIGLFSLFFTFCKTRGTPVTKPPWNALKPRKLRIEKQRFYPLFRVKRLKLKWGKHDFFILFAHSLNTTCLYKSLKTTVTARKTVLLQYQVPILCFFIRSKNLKNRLKTGIKALKTPCFSKKIHFL